MSFLNDNTRAFYAGRLLKQNEEGKKRKTWKETATKKLSKKISFEEKYIHDCNYKFTITFYKTLEANFYTLTSTQVNLFS